MDLDSLLLKNLDDLDRQIEVIKGIARRQDVPPENLQLRDGSFMLTPLLIAKANALLAMAIRTGQRTTIVNYPPDGPYGG